MLFAEANVLWFDIIVDNVITMHLRQQLFKWSAI
jgi:hypothetical protein